MESYKKTIELIFVRKGHSFKYLAKTYTRGNRAKGLVNDYALKPVDGGTIRWLGAADKVQIESPEADERYSAKDKKTYY